MSKKYKKYSMFGLVMAVVGLGLVYKTQVTHSPIMIQSKDKPVADNLIVNSVSEEAKRFNLVPTTGKQQLDIAGELPIITGINSLSGTKIHGDLPVDEEGNLIIEKSVRQLFDYFLNVTGEIPRKTLIEQIKNGIANYLAEPAQSQALELFTNYLEYQEALQAEIDRGLYQVSPGNLDDLQATFEARSQLRSFHLGNEAANAFFQEEEARDEYTLGKLRLNASTDLSDAERDAELSALETTLPENHRKILYKQRNREAIRSRIDDLRKENATIYALQEEWSKHYDSETVERFVKLEA
jgi:lipase chaperone LimK